MIQVTLNFNTEADVVAFFSNKKVAAVTPPAAPATSLVERAKEDVAKNAAAQPASSPSGAKPHAEGKPAAAPEKATESAPAVDYATLQKAVFALAGKSREAAATVAASFGVKTFKDLPQDKWADALAAVNAKLEEVSK